MAESTAEDDTSSESTNTVVIAGAANLAIAVAKALAGAFSGSSAMLSEAAHSFADTVTEVLLFVAIKRGTRPADRRHPLGYGRESYLWALLAAGATFVAGGAASVFEGVQKITNGGEIENPLVPLLVLAVSFVLESISLARALGQVRTSARRFSVRPRLLWRETTDTSVKAVAAEDSAALVGILIAALGIILSAVTRDPLWDGLSSVLIGLLLVVVAGVLAVANAELLVGRAAPLGLDSRLRAELEALPGVASVPVFVTSVTGPRRVLVAAKVNFVDGCTTDDIERVADEAERRMVALFPGVQYVFLDPTAGPGGPEQERADHADAPAPAAEGQGPPADAVRRNRQ